MLSLDKYGSFATSGYEVRWQPRGPESGILHFGTGAKFEEELYQITPPIWRSIVRKKFASSLRYPLCC